MSRKRKADFDTDVTGTPASSTKRATGSKKSKIDQVEEKRLARYKPSCPQNITERVNRVMTQRFFMIDRQRINGHLREEFKVLGSTGNVYTVVIDKLPFCDCPDALKGNHCKHILFIFLKVLSVPLSSGLYYQKALLTSELEEIFAAAPVAPNSLMNQHVRTAYAKATGQEEAEEVESNAKDAGQNRQRIPQEGDDCPICYEDMHQLDVKKLTFCEACGNAVHNECFKQWASTKRPVTCVYCRADWKSGNVATGSSTGLGGVGIQEGYLNFSSVAGLSPVRDTSSYYHGPRHGSRYSHFY